MASTVGHQRVVVSRCGWIRCARDCTPGPRNIEGQEEADGLEDAARNPEARTDLGVSKTVDAKQMAAEARKDNTRK